MNFQAEIKIMPLKELLDPQGKAVLSGLGNLGLKEIEDVRIGKNVLLNIEAASAEEAKSIAEEAASKLLANQVMEEYHVNIL
jgi:phosphoribosylformylglycinamidine synthase